jgi:hypothetical protein
MNSLLSRVSVQRVESLGGHFETLCREFDLDEVKKNIIFKKENNFYSEKSSKRAK